MKNKTWLEQQELAFWKRWNELQAELHWKMSRTWTEKDNENTSLWKQLRKEKQIY